MNTLYVLRYICSTIKQVGRMQCKLHKKRPYGLMRKACKDGCILFDAEKVLTIVTPLGKQVLRYKHGSITSHQFRKFLRTGRHKDHLNNPQPANRPNQQTEMRIHSKVTPA